MPNENGGQNPTENTDRQHVARTPPVTISEQQREVRAEGDKDPESTDTETKKLARELHWLEKGYFVGQTILAIVGIFALFIYHGQLNVMQGQLAEMQQSSRDSTDQANRVIANMNWLAKEMHMSVQEAHSATEVGQKQNRAAVQAVQEQNRPWIEIIGLEPRNDPEGNSVAFGSLTPGEFNVFAFGALTIRNVGHSVATNATIGYKIVAVGQLLDEREVVLKEQRRFCKAFLDGAVEPLNPGILLFTDEPYRTDFGEVERVRDRELQVHGKIRALAIVGCVNYQSNFSTKVYQSGFAYLMAHAGDTSGAEPFIVGRDLSAGQVRTYRFEAADYAK